jgi:predicted dehydrogenase
MAQRHVFVALPVAITERQLLSLDDAARRRSRTLIFDTPSFGDERLAFVRKMTAGPTALWQARYVRSLRTGTSTASLDELAIAEIATMLSLFDEPPARVSAISPRIESELSAPDAVMLTISFASGAVARLDISTAEPAARHEITIACAGRTIVIDALDSRRPLQIQSAGGHGGPMRGQWAETVSEHPSAETPDRLSAAAAAFVAATRSGAAEATNAAMVAGAASVWEHARRSIAADGDPQSLVAQDVTRSMRPELQLIRGRGRTSERSSASLTLVECAEESPPRTA